MMEMQNPFTWGQGGQKLSPAQVAQQRQIAAALAARNSAPKDVGEGLSRVGDALLYRANMDRASKAEDEGRAVREALMAKLTAGDPSQADLIGAMGNDWVQADPGSSAVVQTLLGQEMKRNDPGYQMDLEKSRLELDALRNPSSKPGYRSMTAEEKSLYGVPADAPAQIGPDGKVDIISGGGVNVDVNNMGNIPAGYKVDYDEAGNPVSMSPIPGSPDDVKAKDAAAAAEAGQGTKATYGNIVVEDIGRAVDRIKADPTMTTGMFGSLLANWAGSEAHSVSKLLDTVKANAGFDRLQAMREASPTGGALGAVTERELSLLQSAIGNLEQSQNADDLVFNLKRVQQIYDEIVNGPGGAPKPNIDLTGGKPPEGWSGDPELWQFMTPEERALWQ